MCTKETFSDCVHDDLGLDACFRATVMEEIREFTICKLNCAIKVSRRFHSN
jgi:hypothetical protein